MAHQDDVVALEGAVADRRPRAAAVVSVIAVFCRRAPLGAAMGLVVLTIVGIAIWAPVVAPYDPLASNPRNSWESPSRTHLFGTDAVGRDVLSRIIYGSRVSLIVGVAAVLLGTTSGALWGVVSGYLGGRVDLLGQRFVDIMMAFPSLVLAMVLAVVLGPGLNTLIIAIAATRIPIGVRITRSIALATREQTYVEAARAIGASNLRIVARHVGPSCIAAYLVIVSAHIGAAIIIEASLGFLGVGIPPPTPSWGAMLGSAARFSISPPWWIVVFPGVAIGVLVLAFNLFGDALRDALDPKLRGTEAT